MRLRFIIVFLTALHNASFEEETVTMHIMKRIDVLKQQIKVQNRLRQFNKEPGRITVQNEDAEYEELQTPFTPVMGKPRGRFQLRPLKTTRQRINKHIIRMIPDPKGITTDGVTDDFLPFQPTQSSRTFPLRFQKQLRELLPEIEINQKAEKPFYRRLGDKQFLKTPLPWVHCQDTITQYLTGVKPENTTQNFLRPTSRHVIRLLRLLNVNTTTYTNEEVYSILNQINDIPIRFFQWDVDAMALLFRVLVSIEKPEDRKLIQTFKNIKMEVKAIVAKLHLNIGNATNNLLKKSKIFRPPCMELPQQGSTRRSRSVQYTKSTLPGSKCVKNKLNVKPFECNDG